MTCGSCVNNIEEVLLRLDGVGSVEVNLTSNRGRVTFDPGTVDTAVIAATITGAGYPASLRLELDPREFAALQQEQSELGQQYLARVGDRLLARSDFEQLIRQRSGGVAQQELDDQVWRAVWQDTLQHELLLAAAEQNRVVIQDGEVDARLDELQQGHAGLKQIITQRYGSMAEFRQRLREDMIIERNLKDHVYAGISDPRERQAKLQDWYAALQKNTEVIIFDPRLKAFNQGGSGCACCNS
jgi:copper chaperone CopZ